MKATQVGESADKAFVLILDPGEEAFKAITEFADLEQLAGAAVTAIGAFAHARVGLFDLAAKRYVPAATLDRTRND
jgi:predicted DNA-binding protein with PD1-like motif